eukprot:3880042-Rhodomonas_salina.3
MCIRDSRHSVPSASPTLTPCHPPPTVTPCYPPPTVRPGSWGFRFRVEYPTSRFKVSGFGVQVRVRVSCFGRRERGGEQTGALVAAAPNQRDDHQGLASRMRRQDAEGGRPHAVTFLLLLGTWAAGA